MSYRSAETAVLWATIAVWGTIVATSFLIARIAS